MELLITEHYEVVQILFVGLVGVIGYLFRQNESKSAKLIAGKLEAICIQLDRLYARDELKTEAIIEISDRMTRQEQRCEDREKTCPGKMAHKRLQRHEDQGGCNG